MFNNQSLKIRALDFLSKREYSRLELFNKLKKYLNKNEENFEANLNNLNNLLDFLENINYLNNDRAKESFIRNKKSKFGINKINYELNKKGLNLDLENKEKLNQTEFERALNIWQNKFNNQQPKDAKEYYKQVRFLISRGFNYNIIKKFISSIKH